MRTPRFDCWSATEGGHPARAGRRGCRCESCRPTFLAVRLESVLLPPARALPPWRPLPPLPLARSWAMRLELMGLHRKQPARRYSHHWPPAKESYGESSSVACAFERLTEARLLHEWNHLSNHSPEFILVVHKSHVQSVNARPGQRNHPIHELFGRPDQDLHVEAARDHLA